MLKPRRRDGAREARTALYAGALSLIKQQDAEIAELKATVALLTDALRAEVTR